MTDDHISLAHGGGGLAMQRLIDELLLPCFDNAILQQKEDQARLSLLVKHGEKLAFTTDSYVVTPLEFPGGNIGSLAINGTINDLAVGGALPHSLSCALIIEEGFSLAKLKLICTTMAQAAKNAGVQIVTGDTKVVPRGAADGLFINTSGVGIIPANRDWGMHQIREGDCILLSGPAGDHGATILAAREELALESDIQTDCQPLHELITSIAKVSEIHAIRDATRGGVSAVLHEFASASNLSMLINEQALPIRHSVNSLCELLGMDPLQLACEGRALFIVAKKSAELALQVMQGHPAGKGAAIIGEVTKKQLSPVLMINIFAVSNALEQPDGELLPRIC